MPDKLNIDPKVIDFKSAKSVKDFVETASDRILQLEDALYAILDTHRIDVIKEIAAEVLMEDLEVYMEPDEGMAELNFDNPVDDNMGLPWDEYDT